MIEKLNNVSEFYHDIQFPGHYTQEEVLKNSDDFFLSKYLKLEYLPFRGSLLEAGCGTGYTTHVISNLRRDVKISAVDFSEGSLEFAKNFSNKNNYKNIEFIHMNHKQIKLDENQFDMLVCSGVLHHIDTPQSIFHNLCNLVKKNGTIIIGLYHPWGRTSVHIRQKIFKITRGKMRWLDPRIRNENWTDQRKNTWYRDQYEHPYERDYSHKVLLKWFDDENVSFLGSIPNYNWLGKGKRNDDFSYNFHLLTRYGSQGGLYIFIGKKN